MSGKEKEIQKAAILRYIEAHGWIDAVTALVELGIMRLGARIWDLKNDGFPIVSRWAYKYDDRGRVVKKWKEYGIA